MYESSIDEFKFYAGLTTVSGPGDRYRDSMMPSENIHQHRSLLYHDIYINEIINIYELQERRQFP